MKKSIGIVEWLYSVSCNSFKLIHIKFHAIHRMHMVFTFSDNGNCILCIHSTWNVYVNIKLNVLRPVCRRLHRLYGKRIVQQMVIDETDPMHPIKLMEYQFHSRMQIDAPIFHFFVNPFARTWLHFGWENEDKNECKAIYVNELSFFKWVLCYKTVCLLFCRSNSTRSNSK